MSAEDVLNIAEFRTVLEERDEIAAPPDASTNGSLLHPTNGLPQPTPLPPAVVPLPPPPRQCNFEILTRQESMDPER